MHHDQRNGLLHEALDACSFVDLRLGVCGDAELGQMCVACAANRVRLAYNESENLDKHGLG